MPSCVGATAHRGPGQFWFSREPLGGCSAGPYAQALSASPWHFPRGLTAIGTPMMLFLQAFTTPNEYTAHYKWAGQSVAGSDSARFFADRFRELHVAPAHPAPQRGAHQPAAGPLATARAVR